MCEADSIFFIYKVVDRLKDFWNFFLNKGYLKCE